MELLGNIIYEIGCIGIVITGVLALSAYIYNKVKKG